MGIGLYFRYDLTMFYVSIFPALFSILISNYFLVIIPLILFFIGTVNQVIVIFQTSKNHVLFAAYIYLHLNLLYFSCLWNVKDK